MWDANANDGVRKEGGWRSGLRTFKVKVPISDVLQELVEEHLYEEHPEWCEGPGEEVGVETPEEVFVYVNVNSVNGEIEVVGVDGHPVDKTRKFK